MPRWDRLELDAAVDALDQRKKKSTLRRKSSIMGSGLL
jgi:hypothetical protein